MITLVTVYNHKFYMPTGSSVKQIKAFISSKTNGYLQPEDITLKLGGNTLADSYFLNNAVTVVLVSDVDLFVFDKYNENCILCDKLGINCICTGAVGSKGVIHSENGLGSESYLNHRLINSKLLELCLLKDPYILPIIIQSVAHQNPFFLTYLGTRHDKITTYIKDLLRQDTELKLSYFVINGIDPISDALKQIFEDSKKESASESESDDSTTTESTMGDETGESEPETQETDSEEDPRSWSDVAEDPRSWADVKAAAGNPAEPTTPNTPAGNPAEPITLNTPVKESKCTMQHNDDEFKCTCCMTEAEIAANIEQAKRDIADLKRIETILRTVRPQGAYRQSDIEDTYYLYNRDVESTVRALSGINSNAALRTLHSLAFEQTPDA